MTRVLEVAVERWPIAGSFVIARGAKTEAVVVTALIRDGTATGRGEAVPYARYGESVESVTAAMQAMAEAIASGVDRAALQALLPPGAARNALDCALWDLEAKATSRRAAEIAGLAPLRAVETAYTLSLGEPAAMAEAARRAADRPLLKLKLGGAGDGERLAAIRAAVPRARLIADANESWSRETWNANMAAAVAAGVELIEQPLPARADDLLGETTHPVPICADESVHSADDLPGLAGRYDAVNIKLDKAGGLTEALRLAAEARDLGLTIMVGCMVATSLAMAPAMLVAQGAAFVDLDGPLLLARDRQPGLRYAGSRIEPPEAALWG